MFGSCLHRVRNGDENVTHICIFPDGSSFNDSSTCNINWLITLRGEHVINYAFFKWLQVVHLQGVNAVA